jgi:anti-sigma regulatory factor (Ser/Thr protein kinase)
MIAMKKKAEEGAGHLDATLDLPADTTSPATARRFVRSVLTGWGCDHLSENALLITSELVTNAIVHARSPLRLRLRLADDVVRIEVADRGDGTPQPRVPDRERPGGRGLPIIEALSLAWGMVPTADGKVVWADLPS